LERSQTRRGMQASAKVIYWHVSSTEEEDSTLDGPQTTR
jgi:hypothetical protein